MSEEAVVDTAPVESTETAPTEQSNEPSQASMKAWLASNAPEGASTKWLDKYEDDTSVANGIYALSSLAGKKGDIPASDSDPTIKAEFAEKLGFTGIEEGKSYVELDQETYGDIKSEWEPTYNQGIEDVMGRIVSKFKENPSPQAIEQALVEWAQEDAQFSLQQQAEDKKRVTEEFNTFAVRNGLTPEQLQEQESELMKRHGWDGSTSIHEVMLTMLKSTSNSTTIQEAHMNNTKEGLQSQIDSLQVELEDASVPAAQHKLNLDKMRGLLKNQASLLERG